jgi:hypothetical protein
MARYVDVEKLIAECDRVHIGAAGGARKLMEEAPTADVQEVKHGRWIPCYKEVKVYNSGGFMEKKQTGWICGKCKRKKSFTPYGTENYCSNCGVKMDRKDET